ncbi:hypothetical protein N9O56_02385 [Rickettsiales bacterium]|nr:hypothetical protein [Rickettsiales bacterium]
MGTKNNPKNRAKAIEKKKHDGKDLEPILYSGIHSGHGKYVAAKYAGTTNIVNDETGKPIPWAEF